MRGVDLAIAISTYYEELPETDTARALGRSAFKRDGHRGVIIQVFLGVLVDLVRVVFSNGLVLERNAFIHLIDQGYLF